MTQATAYTPQSLRSSVAVWVTIQVSSWDEFHSENIKIQGGSWNVTLTKTASGAASILSSSDEHDEKNNPHYSKEEPESTRH